MTLECSRQVRVITDPSRVAKPLSTLSLCEKHQCNTEWVIEEKSAYGGCLADYVLPGADDSSDVVLMMMQWLMVTAMRIICITL